MKIAIFGGTGFVGSYIIDELFNIDFQFFAKLQNEKPFFEGK